MTHTEGVTDQLLHDLAAALGQAYSIHRELPGGGMSRVFVAREAALGREVVIKVLPPELAAGINRERFRREVQLAAQISHPYIVPLLHAGEAGELLWFTMPYISGESLRTRLEQHGPLPVREVLQLLRDVVEALAYAHARGVIHRDIKPANILSDGAHALVTDFGVAKALGASLPLTGVAGHTTSGVAIGTPAYMAPEQLAADPSADHRVDIYAVGLLAYELLAGASPFAAPSPTATMTAQLTRVPVSLSTLRPDVPTPLAHLVDHCLAKSADHRPPNAQAVLAELDRISGVLAADAHRESSGERQGEAIKPASSVPLVLAGMALVGLIVGGAWWSSRGGAPPPASPETVLVPTAGDAAQSAALPAAPLTRADSLAIAAALRDELERIDPVAARRAPAVPEAPATPEDDGPVTVTLARQLAVADSLVRVKLNEISLRNVEALVAAEAARRLDRPTIGPAPGTARKSVLVVASRGRSREPASNDLATKLADELGRRLGRSDRWQVITPDVAEAKGAAGELPADVLVSVGIDPVGGDSGVARIAVRNLAPGSQFGFNVVTSRPFATQDGLQGAADVIGQALGMLNNLHRLGRGETWTLDMGRPPRPPED